MNTQHTPGPWVVDHSHPDWVEGTTIWANDVVIAHAVADQHHETEANARLIAAAPEMLDLLYTVLPYIEDLELDQMYKPGVVAALTRRIRDTLDKAEGVQP